MGFFGLKTINGAPNEDFWLKKQLTRLWMGICRLQNNERDSGWGFVDFQSMNEARHEDFLALKKVNEVLNEDYLA